MSQLGATAAESTAVGNRTTAQTSLSKDGHLLAHVPRKDTRLAHLWVELDAGVHCSPSPFRGSASLSEFISFHDRSLREEIYEVF